MNNPTTLAATPLDSNGQVLTYQQEDRGAKGWAALIAPATLAAGPSANNAGLGIHNPVGSGVNLVIRSAQIALSAAPAGAVTMYYTKYSGGNPTTISSTNVNQNNIVPLNTPYAMKGVALSGGSVLAGAPKIVRVAQSILASGAQAQSIFDDDIEGEIILEPGAQMLIQSSAACNMYASLVWEEVIQF